MVDVQASNKKLVRRSERILARLTGRDGAEIGAALVRAGGSVKLAYLLLEGHGLGEAQAALECSRGHLRRAVEALSSAK